MTGVNGGTLDLQWHVWYANTNFSFPLLVQGLKRGVSCLSFRRRDEPNRITVGGGRILMSGLKCRKRPFLCHGVASRCRRHKTRELLVRGETSTERFECFLCRPSVLLVYHLSWRRVLCCNLEPTEWFILSENASYSYFPVNSLCCPSQSEKGSHFKAQNWQRVSFLLSVKDGWVHLLYNAAHWFQTKNK